MWAEGNGVLLYAGDPPHKAAGPRVSSCQRSR